MTGSNDSWELKCRQDDGQNMTKIIAHSAMVCLIGDGAFPDVESACHPVEQTFRHWAEASQLHWLKPVSHQGIRYYGPRATATVPDDRYLFGTMIMDTRWGHGARQ